MRAYQVLCTKKIAAQLTLKAALDDIEIIEKEFITITPVISNAKRQEIITRLENGTGTIVFTSANAAAIFCDYVTKYKIPLPASLKVFSMAGKTSQQLAPCFNESAIAGTANSADALAKVILKKKIKEILFFCGNKRRDELPDKLRANGTIVEEVVLYKTTEVPFKELGELKPDGLMFFSPSAVTSFFSANTIQPATVCFAIGNTTAAAIKEHTKNRIIVSKVPDEKSMMADVTYYFQHINQ